MTSATAEKTPSQIAVFREQLDHMQDQFRAALPAHIPVERFARVVMTAIQNNPKLLACTRQSLWNACMRAAQDGLLPDGREGAIVSYGENEDGRKRADIAQWMPMIAGLRKKARNSGEIAGWEAHCVYENDEFDYELGDEPFIRHKPALGDRGKIIAAYSIATLKDGYKSREVMPIREVEGVRSKSKAKKGPWQDPIFYPEMVRKVVARRHSKVLPMSTDLDDLIRRDDELYDLDSAKEEAIASNRPRSLIGKLDALVASPERMIDVEPAEAPQSDGEPVQAGYDGEPDEAAPAPPEPQETAGVDDSVTWRNGLLKLFADVQTEKARQTLWKTQVETKRAEMFPGDVADVEKAFNKAGERLAKGQAQ